MGELLHEIGSSLRQNKLRTALTGFAVSWGIFLLIALLGAGNGLMNSFLGNVQDFISQSVQVEGWRTSKPYAGYKEGRWIQLDQRDADYANSPRWQGIVENVTTTTSTKSTNLVLDGNTVNGWLTGVQPDYQDQAKLKMAAGRFINKADVDQKRKVIVISTSQAKELCPQDPESLIGKWVKAGELSFQLIGLFIPMRGISAVQRPSLTLPIKVFMTVPTRLRLCRLL